MSDLNVLVLSSWYPTEKDPFIGNFVRRHCEAISREVKVWVFHTVEDEKEESIRKEVKQSGNLTEVILYLPESGNPLSKYRGKKKAILAAIEKSKIEFDILHAHVLYPMAPLFASVAKRLNIPWVFTEHWSGFHRRFRPKINPLKWRWIMERSNTAKMGFPVSENLASSIQSELPSMTLELVPNVVKDEFFERSVSDKDALDSTIRFLHVSTLDEKYKNISGTLEAFAKLKESGEGFSFTIVTDGDSTFANHRVVELGLEDEVDFKGPMQPAEIADEMVKADALVLFSNTENQPCVILESLAMGLPVIASSVGDIPNLVTDGKGILVSPGDTDQLRGAFISFIDNKDFSKCNFSSSPTLPTLKFLFKFKVC